LPIEECAMVAVPAEQIRNVLLLGHTGTGKSTLVEAMLRAAGYPSDHAGRPATVDTEPEEVERGHSLSLSLVSFEFEGYKLNVLDAPGGAEVLGDAYPALPAADTAVFVVDGTVGVQPQHVELWHACEQRQIPRVVFINKLDLQRSRFQETLDDLAERYGTPLAAVHVPLYHDDRLEGVVDLLHGLTVEEHDGQRSERPLSEGDGDPGGRNRERLVEAIVETDDELLERYLDGQQPEVDELVTRFADGIARSRFFPVLGGSAREDVGIKLLLRFLIEECPSPAAPGEPADDGPTAVYVAKTFSDPYVGRINLLRVLSGKLQADDELRVDRTRQTERLRHLFTLRGSEHVAVDAAVAGDLVAVSKLDDVLTGDVVRADTAEVSIEVPEPPEGFHRVVLEPVSSGDDAKLSLALQRILQDDPSIRSSQDPDSQVRVLSFLGPTHVEVTVARLSRRYGVSVEVRPAPIAYRSTIRSPATGTGRHVKQSGGHGQYGIAVVEIEPLPRGSGFSFENVSVGGVVPGQYVSSVEKGVQEAMRAGPLGGVPVVDVGVRLVDGKHHAVDSSDGAFQMAGILAFRAAVAEADPVLLEPVAAVLVTVPDELTGAVLSDLSARRGRIVATGVTEDGASRIQAQVPEAELVTFASDLRALTGGRATATTVYDHHTEVPDQVAQRVLAEMPIG
jgi:elongation factor G